MQNMKATGIVRNIDDLGRVVLPKETRKILHMENGDPVEIFTGDGGEIIIRKYEPFIDHSTDIQRKRHEIQMDNGIDSAKKTDALVLLDKVAGLLK